MMMKKILIGILILLVALIGFIGWYRWDSGRNRGYEFGYWGSFNRISNAMTRLPGISIVNSGHNADVTLEEFGFDIRNRAGRTLHIWFMEGDPIRRLSGERLTKALTERIEKESSNQASEATSEPAPGAASSSPQG